MTPYNLSLFPSSDGSASPPEHLREGAVLLRGFASNEAPQLLAEVGKISEVAGFRNMMTPGGHVMSVAMTNCGAAGWVTDRKGYRYTELDPLTGKSWPAMPEIFLHLAQRASAAAGFPNFCPDACLINRYTPGARMTMHQDRNEQDFREPIVSVSLGLPATFLFGEVEHRNHPQRITIAHGDVVVWGGPARLAYHGILRLQAGHHELTGDCRINLTFRKAL